MRDSPCHAPWFTLNQFNSRLCILPCKLNFPYLAGKTSRTIHQLASSDHLNTDQVRMANSRYTLRSNADLGKAVRLCEVSVGLRSHLLITPRNSSDFAWCCAMSIVLWRQDCASTVLSCVLTPCRRKSSLVILIPVLLRQARAFSTVFNPPSARRCDSAPEALGAVTVTVVMLPRGW
jgi:hypothetical protein